MLITKADGTVEQFKPGKLRTSLRRAGAHKSEVEKIVKDIEATLTEGDRTQAIYRKAFAMLQESERPVAAKYSLRRALFGLGPTGFPFEDFLARLFELEGYTAMTRVEVKGKCATHEIDLAAYTPEYSFVAEAKFHSRPGIKSDLQVALYSYARFLDLKSIPVCREDICGVHDLFIITNTKFTKTVIDYTACVGIKLLSWDYPKHENLQDRIEAASVYPISALTTLSTSHKIQLLESGAILCRDVLKNPDMLRKVGMGDRKIAAVLDEAGALCV